MYRARLYFDSSMNPSDWDAKGDWKTLYSGDDLLEAERAVSEFAAENPGYESLTSIEVTDGEGQIQGAWMVSSNQWDVHYPYAYLPPLYSGEIPEFDGPSEPGMYYVTYFVRGEDELVAYVGPSVEEAAAVARRLQESPQGSLYIVYEHFSGKDSEPAAIWEIGDDSWTVLEKTWPGQSVPRPEGIPGYGIPAPGREEKKAPKEGGTSVEESQETYEFYAQDDAGQWVVLESTENYDDLNAIYESLWEEYPGVPIGLDAWVKINGKKVKKADFNVERGDWELTDEYKKIQRESKSQRPPVTRTEERSGRTERPTPVTRTETRPEPRPEPQPEPDPEVTITAPEGRAEMELKPEDGGRLVYRIRREDDSTEEAFSFRNAKAIFNASYKFGKAAELVAYEVKPNGKVEYRGTWSPEEDLWRVEN